MDRRAFADTGNRFGRICADRIYAAIMATDKHKGPAALLFADMEPRLTKIDRNSVF